MKPGFYVGSKGKDLYLVLQNDEGVVELFDGFKLCFPVIFPSAYLPATRQDIIDKLLPLIPEPKEPGQVAYEGYYSALGSTGGDWHDRPEKTKNFWANAERAVLEAYQK